MSTTLIVEYIIIQIVLLLLIYFYSKDFLYLWKKNPHNSYGITSSLGVVLSSFLGSILLYFIIFHKHVSIISLIFGD